MTQQAIRLCPGCGKTFHPNNGKHKWCTAGCRAAHWREQHGNALPTRFAFDSGKLTMEKLGVRDINSALHLSPSLDLPLDKESLAIEKILSPDALKQNEENLHKAKLGAVVKHVVTEKEAEQNYDKWFKKDENK